MERTPPSPDQTVGERTASNVRAELARRKLSGRALARACNWPKTTTYRRLTGEIPLTVDEVSAIAAWLEVPVADLIGTAPAAAPA